VGTNGEDIEQVAGGAPTAARGAVFRTPPTAPANWRSNADLEGWLARRGVVGLSGVDTRALTRRIRERGMPLGIVAHAPDGRFDVDALVARAKGWNGLVGLDLAKDASCEDAFDWSEGAWCWPDGHGQLEDARFHVVVIDYGTKRNILRSLVSIGARVTVVPATASAEMVLAHEPDGIVLSNGPGDPAATAEYAAPVIRQIIASGTPTFGICLGHQLLALALGGTTRKMDQGHHGANHPVKELANGSVQIVSMNHGFTVARESLPTGLTETHVSLFDGTNSGLQLTDRPVFSVQHHPEASPGPGDALPLFLRFAELMEATRTKSLPARSDRG
jgi:carbamoyl-phosphate synthase small subunit